MTQILCIAITGLLALSAPATRDVSRLKYVAHQGLEALAPSHSAAAYRLAVEQGFDIMKMDIQRTKDGELVLSHDPDLKATMKLDWKIKEHTFKEIREQGRFLPRGGYSNEVIQTFSEGLVYAKQLPEIWIDFKHFAPESAERIVEELKKNGVSSERVMIATYNTKALEYMRDKHPEFRRVAHTQISRKDNGYRLNFDSKQVFENEDQLVEAILKEKERLGLFGVNLPYSYLSMRKTYFDTPKGIIPRLKAKGLWLSAWFAFKPGYDDICREMGYDCVVSNGKTRPKRK